MSDPTKKHIWDPREGQWVPARFAQMRCDGMSARCPLPPIRAPRLQVPPKPWVLGGPKNMRMMTTLHYCQRHTGEMTVEKLLQPDIMARMEALAEKKWPHGVKPDFEAAWIEWVLTTTPEYRAFLAGLELNTLLPSQAAAVM